MLYTALLGKIKNNETYRHVTPAMAMGLTDHPWSMRELMAFSYRNYIN